MDEFINVLLKLGKDEWVVMVIIGSVLYKLFCEIFGVERIKKANLQFVKLMEEAVCHSLVGNVDFLKMENIVNIICKKNNVNREYIMSYNLALSKAVFNCMEKSDYKYEELMRFENVYANLKSSAVDMDIQIRNSNRMIYFKGYLLATVVFFLIALMIVAADGEFVWKFTSVLLVLFFAMFYCACGALISLFIEKIFIRRLITVSKS